MRGFTNFLFAPGSRPDRIAKALNSSADFVCADLEDAVPALDKATAREAVLAMVEPDNTAQLAIRINGLRTAEGLKDLLALAELGTVPELIFLPMVESASEIEIARSVLADRACAFVPLIETVEGLRNGDAIASADGTAAMMFGGGDFSAQLGTKLEWEPLLHARSQFILCCASARKTAIDVPYIDLENEAGLVEECARAKALGFHAKAAIHPKQITTIAQQMMPSEHEVEEARAAVAAFEQAGGKAISFRGRMLEAPFMARYEQILAVAQ